MTGILEAIAISAAVSLISAGITYALTPTQKISGQRLQDLTTSKSNYGVTLPWCWGTVRVGGNLIWTTFKEETTKTEKVGKGAKAETEKFSYFGNFANAFCYCPFRPVAAIPRIWANKELIYSTVGTPATIAEGGKFADQYLRFYYGDQFQDIDPLIDNLDPISNYTYGIPAGKAARDAYLQSLGINPDQTVLTPGYNKRCYVVAQRMPLGDFFNRLPGLEAELIASQNCTTGQIIGDIMSLFFEPNRYDVSLLTDPVDGFFINTIEAAKSAIQSLQQAYFFDIVQSGDVITFVPLKHPRNVVNLDVVDLAAHQSGSQKPLDYEIVEDDLTSLPSEVKVTYIDKDLNYDQNEQNSSLEVKRNENPNIVTIGLNIVMGASEAATIADRAMFLAWLQRKKYKFNLPPAYLDLEPADLIANVFDSSGNTIKITQLRHGADFTSQVEGVPHDPSFLNFARSLESGAITLGIADYSVVITTNGTPTGVVDDQGNSYVENTDYTVNGNEVTILSTGNIPAGTNIIVSSDETVSQDPNDLGSIPSPGDTDLKVLDIPLIKDSDDDYTTYIVGTGGADWTGASLYISTDNSSYNFAGTLDTYSVIGETIGTLGSTGNVTVTVNQQVLESITDNDLALGLNLALVGDEIIQYKYATLIDTNTFELSELTRGLRGTDCKIDSHVANECFVLLAGNGAYYAKAIASQADMGQIRYFKAPSAGQALSDVTPTQITYQAISMRPYSPVNLSATKNNVGDISITWDRRDRHAALNTNNPPLSETSEDYAIQIINPNNSNIIRTATANINTYIYLATDQITDFGVTQTSITVKIAQVSSVFTEGCYTAATVLTPVQVEPPPTITSFTPASGLIGDTISIVGNNLSQTTNVQINQINQDNIVIVDNQNITFDIAPNTVSSGIQITTLGGTATSNALIIENPLSASGFPQAQKTVSLPYLLETTDYNTEIICTTPGAIKIPDTSTGFVDYWGCWISLDGSGIVTFERDTGGTAGIIQSNTLGADDTVKLWHRGNNVWKLD